jgi:hypothetical protein
MDSGAFSFFTKDPSLAFERGAARRQSEQPDPEEFFDRYVQWLKPIHSGLDIAAELDLQEMIGQERIEDWRQRLIREGLADKIAIVYHPATQTIEEFLGQAEKWPSRWVATQGILKGRVTIPYQQILRFCYKRGIKVHIFGVAGPNLLKFPFYSSDATNWGVGDRFGLIPAWTGERVKFLHLIRGQTRPEERALFRSWLAANGFTLDDIINEDDKKRQRKHRRLLGARAYARYGEHITSVWEARGIRWEEQIAKVHG